MRVIGTAGHVDHGKSTLIRRLTGIDPDRLAEEQARQMTIDLGFAWLALPDGETLGIVDVPGHRDFIENMLAGGGGSDAVLLVIAADEGVMPQTREHLAILDLLAIQRGLIVLTKTDLIDDPDWLDLIEQDIHAITEGTSLEEAEIIRVSAHTGDGLPHLVDSLTALVREIPPRTDYRHPRLPIDRVFTISGFGTVVTGTLLGGMLRVGDEIEIQPPGLRARIRGLQSYKQSVEVAQPGSRVAVNLSGIDKKAVERGFVLAHPGQLQPALLVDVHFRHLKDASRPLKHNAVVKFYAGAAESPAHVRLLANETLLPGAEGWLQIRLEKPLALAQGDRCILRYPSPGETIGGGVVVNPQPGRRWKRFQPEVLRQLETRMQGTPAQRVAQAASGTEPVKRPELQKVTGYTDAELGAAIEAAINDGLLLALADGSFYSTDAWRRLTRRITDELGSFHSHEPLRVGMSREELRSRIGIKQALLNMVLDTHEGITADGATIRLKTHQVHFTSAQQAQIQELMRVMEVSPYTPPAYREAAQMVGEDVLRALIETGEIVQVQADIIFSKEAFEAMVTGVLRLIDERGSVTASMLRDTFHTSRKYAIGLLEYLDVNGITHRVGDTRVRGTRSRSHDNPFNLLSRGL